MSIGLAGTEEMYWAVTESNTEPLIRLNVEACGEQAALEPKINNLKKLIESP